MKNVATAMKSILAIAYFSFGSCVDFNPRCVF